MRDLTQTGHTASPVRPCGHRAPGQFGAPVSRDETGGRSDHAPSFAPAVRRGAGSRPGARAAGVPCPAWLRRPLLAARILGVVAQREEGAERSGPRVIRAEGNSLAESAYRRLKADILTCRLAPGAMLAAPRLAETLEMSRTPVHEALKTLCQEGLLVVEPRAGYRVTAVTTRDVEEIFDLRLARDLAQAAQRCDVSAERARNLPGGWILL